MSRSRGSWSFSTLAIVDFSSQIECSPKGDTQSLLTGHWDLPRVLGKGLAHTRCRLLQQLLGLQFQGHLPLWRDYRMLASSKRRVDRRITHLCTKWGAMISARWGLSCCDDQQQSSQTEDKKKQTSRRQETGATALLSTWPQEGATLPHSLPRSAPILCVQEKRICRPKQQQGRQGSTPAADGQGLSLGSCDLCATECRAMCGVQCLQRSLHVPTRPAPGRATRHLRGVMDVSED